MKKIIAILLSALLVLSLTACTAPTGGDLQKPVDVDNNQQPDTGSTGDNNPSADQTTTITETVLVDEAGVKITAKSLSADSIFGSAVKLLIENDSGKDLTFQSRNTSVNGYMVETMMSVDVVNGKKANDSLTFLQSDLDACGISTIADMEFSFHIFTTEDWETYLDTPQIQLKTSIADTYTYTFDDSGNLAYEGNDVKVVVKGLSQDDSLLGPGIVIYLENNSGKNVTFQTRDVSINGFMFDPVFSADVMAGKRAVDSITFLSSEFEENGITEIESVELSFHIFDTSSWDAIVDTDTVTINF